MISEIAVPPLLNRLESYEPVPIKRVVNYLHKTTGKTILTSNDSYYDAYTLPLSKVCDVGSGHVKVLIDSTVPNYGGLRYWLVCEHCRRKVTNLYPAGATIACRRCLGLEYSSRMYSSFTPGIQLGNLQKAAKLMATRRLVYAGKPTRAGRRLNRLITPDEYAGLVISAMGLPL